MKFRTDFVTNSSSSGFVAVYAVSKTGQAVQLYMAEEYIEVDEEMLAQVLALESMEDWYQWLHDLEEANDCEIGYLTEEEWDENADPEMLAKKAYQCLLQGVIETIDDLAGVKVDTGEDAGGEFVDPEEAAEAVGLDLDELEWNGLDEEASIVGCRKVYYSEMADRTEGDIWEDESIHFTNVDLQGTGIELSETFQEGQIAVSYQGKCRVLPRSQVQNYVNELLQQKKQEDQDKNYVNVTLLLKGGKEIAYRFGGGTLGIEDKKDQEPSDAVFHLSSIDEFCQWLQDFLEPCKDGQETWNLLLHDIHQYLQSMDDVAKFSMECGVSLNALPLEQEVEEADEIYARLTVDFVAQKIEYWID